jgi:hypothetical protein
VSQDLSIQHIITKTNDNVQNFFLEGFWIEAITSLSTFTLHDYKANCTYYFQKFKNVKVESYLFFSPIGDVIGYNIFQEDHLNFKSDKGDKFEKKNYKFDEHENFIKFDLEFFNIFFERHFNYYGIM